MRRFYVQSPVYLVRVWEEGIMTRVPVSPTFYSWCPPTFLHYFYPRFIHHMSSYKADVKSAKGGFWQQAAQLTWPGARWDEKALYSSCTLSSPGKGGIPPFHPPQVYAPQHSHGFLIRFMCFFPPEFCLRSVSVQSFEILLISVYDNELFLWICWCDGCNV